MDSASEQNQIIASNKSRVHPRKALLIVVTAVLVIAAAAIVIVAFLINQKKNNPGSPSASGSTPSNSTVISEDPGVLNNLSIDKTEDVNAARKSAANYQVAIIKKMTEKHDDNFGYQEAIKEYSEKVDSLSGIAQFYYGIRYAEFYFVWGYGKDTINTVLNEATKIAQKYEPFATTDITRIDYLINLQNIYATAGKTTETEIYRREIEKLTTNDQNGKG